MPFFHTFKLKSLLNAHNSFLWCLCHSQHIHFAVEMVVVFGSCVVRLSRLRGVLTQWRVIMFVSCVVRLSRLRDVLTEHRGGFCLKETPGKEPPYCQEWNNKYLQQFFSCFMI